VRLESSCTHNAELLLRLFELMYELLQRLTQPRL
jgi:hypothetical protein